MKDKITEVYDICIRKNLVFATFRLPRKTESTTYVQLSSESLEWNSLNDLSSEKGFIMAPFDNRNGKKYILVKPDLAFDSHHPSGSQMDELRSIQGNPEPEWDFDAPVVTGKEQYLDHVESFKSNISKGYFQKSVLSRIKTVNGNYISSVIHIYQELCQKHPNAFVYIFKSDQNFWLGASPEPLLRLTEGTVSTVSLAGTRPYSEKNMDINNWTMKEALEQEYVTSYIHDKLREFQIREYKNTSPYVKKAGDLIHLRTDFSFDYAQVKAHIWEFLDALHPTPAVAGQPKDEAVSFIKSTETHDREYYTGFLGPVRSNDTIDLFVNLRCMKITPDYLSLFIGGGITLESSSEDEWVETQLKARSLLSIIERFSNN